jgi:SMI1 / KNR4 family (SUKH-1)
MELLNIIENTIDKIKKCDDIEIQKINIEEVKEKEEDRNWHLSNSLKQIYTKYKKIKLSWNCKVNGDKGYIELLSIDEIISKQEELEELAKEFYDDDTIEDIDTIIEDIRNWLPLFRFPNGDMFCMDKRNDKIVFFEHEVFDTGINLHGLIISNSFEELIMKWSSVLFIDIYDWYDGVDRNDGIDLRRDVYKNIIAIANK